MKHEFSSFRRAILRRTVAGFAAAAAGAAFLPVARLLASPELPRASEDEPTAKALKYVNDAERSQRPATDQFCNNCRYYKGDANTEWARCDLFPGKLVAGAGWCNVWARKG
jgi:hypothetical protein